MRSIPPLARRSSPDDSRSTHSTSKGESSSVVNHCCARRASTRLSSIRSTLVCLGTKSSSDLHLVGCTLGRRRQLAPKRAACWRGRGVACQGLQRRRKAEHLVLQDNPSLLR